ncbi:DUF2716 domain-containing protein [Micromonospora sp. C28SCA-DRY-2]|uniref:DUF2716 domain-containing protein n=1 Tax=Micromonospora sp. C28SCA-DRY-2 TaxID=3059522 RepID=UPI002674BFC9|nr:DUF2716 domain-containing protein [Micromonospora sp. C28SCA-DRY-2]MDO3703272.1 DUF2716 domain-containing protein [Micromonospora sp. C28SCA-DRY-2]
MQPVDGAGNAGCSGRRCLRGSERASVDILVGPENIDPPGRPGWPLLPYPDGDYYIYLAEDFRFGAFGHPRKLSLCVFGGGLLDLVEADLHDLLGKVMRRVGRQVTA